MASEDSSVTLPSIPLPPPPPGPPPKIQRQRTKFNRNNVRISTDNVTTDDADNEKIPE